MLLDLLARLVGNLLLISRNQQSVDQAPQIWQTSSETKELDLSNLMVTSRRGPARIAEKDHTFSYADHSTSMERSFERLKQFGSRLLAHLRRPSMLSFEMKQGQGLETGIRRGESSKVVPYKNS